MRRGSAYTCLSGPPAVHIPLHACAYSAYTCLSDSGPGFEKLEKTDPIRGDPLEWVLESVIFLTNLADRAICTICAAHALHIALSIK